MTNQNRTGWTRRRVLAAGLGGAAVIVAGGLELVDHGVLPGKHTLDVLDGACSVPTPSETFRSPGETITGRIYSRARRREVGYTIAYPPGHSRGSRLPLGLYLHADGGSHTSTLGGLPLARALAGNGLPGIALVAADGGNLYWHPHPGDNPMGMMIDEIIPMCQRLGLGTTPGQIGTIGISMGGYGAILFAEKLAQTISACAAISPAIWTTYAQAHAANPGAYTNAREFAEYDAITHTNTLAQVPVRVASGTDDPFHPGVVTLIERLPPQAITDITGGCHDGKFFASQRHASLLFLGQHLTA
jgi:pimeloyl-ACP methyl ester carboxylesterase